MHALLSLMVMPMGWLIREAWENGEQRRYPREIDSRRWRILEFDVVGLVCAPLLAVRTEKPRKGFNPPDKEVECMEMCRMTCAKWWNGCFRSPPSHAAL